MDSVITFSPWPPMLNCRKDDIFQLVGEQTEEAKTAEAANAMMMLYADPRRA